MRSMFFSSSMKENEKEPLFFSVGVRYQGSHMWFRKLIKENCRQSLFGIVTWINLKEDFQNYISKSHYNISQNAGKQRLRTLHCVQKHKQPATRAIHARAGMILIYDEATLNGMRAQICLCVTSAKWILHLRHGAVCVMQGFGSLSLL